MGMGNSVWGEKINADGEEGDTRVGFIGRWERDTYGMRGDTCRNSGDSSCRRESGEKGIG